MKTDTHTQGPWHVGAGNGEGSIFADDGRTRLEIGGTTLYSIAQITRGWNEAEDEANARLIAAAPELLAALESLAVGLSPASVEMQRENLDDLFRVCRELAENALAKAKGGDA
jgi:hypothetical protein